MAAGLKEATEPLMPRKQGSGTACRSLHPSDKAQWCQNCCSKRGKCTGLPTGTAAEPLAPKPQPNHQRVAPKRDVPRDLKKDSPSRKLLPSEVKHMRRDPSRTAHNLVGLAKVLLSKEATPGESQ